MRTVGSRGFVRENAVDGKSDDAITNTYKRMTCGIVVVDHDGRREMPRAVCRRSVGCVLIRRAPCYLDSPTGSCAAVEARKTMLTLPASPRCSGSAPRPFGRLKKFQNHHEATRHAELRIRRHPRRAHPDR